VPKQSSDQLAAAESKLHDLMTARIDAQQKRVDEAKAALDAFDKN
jgi:hypothetical protein